MSRCYIGIDPDVEKSGFALIWDDYKFIDAVSFFDLFDTLNQAKDMYKNPFIRIEAGWLKPKSNWHGGKYQSKATGEMIAKKVGSNHQVGKLIAQMCEYLMIEYELVLPQGKVSTDTFYRLTGVKMLKKDQDKIDAYMLIYDFNKTQR